MKRFAIIVAYVTLAACQTTQAERRAFCNEKLAIAVVEKPADAVETADNDYDTDATVENVKAHAKVVNRICGLVPAPQR